MLQQVRFLHSCGDPAIFSKTHQNKLFVLTLKRDNSSQERLAGARASPSDRAAVVSAHSILLRRMMAGSRDAVRYREQAQSQGGEGRRLAYSVSRKIGGYGPVDLLSLMREYEMIPKA